MNTSLVIAVVCGLAAGIFLMWLFNRGWIIRRDRERSTLEQQLAVEKERSESRENRIRELNTANEALQQQAVTDKSRVAELQAQLEQERRSTQEKLAVLEKAEKNMTTAFENLANRIVEEKSKKFTEQNKLNIGEVLNPLREQLGEFRKKIDDVYDKETRDRMSLYHEIKNLKTLNEQMSQDAVNLTRALKGESKTRGNWGEVILERVLEESGLKNGREYETQESFRDDNNKRFSPDVIVHLPDNKDVIIDSKVSLNAYEKYCSVEDESERSNALDEHLASIRAHVKGLQEKNYDKLLGVNSLDMVLMFVPIEPALMLAFEHDENLFRDAFRQRIYLVSPSTLTMNLQIIHNVWRNEYQNRNAQEIAKRAGDMYDKFVLFVEALDDVGDKLDRAQDAYQTAHNRLTDGRGNLVKRAEDIRKLGLQTDKQLPKHLVNKIYTEEDDTPALDVDDENREN